MTRGPSSDKTVWSSMRIELMKLSMGKKKKKRQPLEKSQYFKEQAKKKKFVKAVDGESLKRFKEDELWAQCQCLNVSGSNAVKYYKQKDIW